jgi:hypothetical protein
MRVEWRTMVWAGVLMGMAWVNWRAVEGLRMVLDKLDSGWRLR